MPPRSTSTGAPAALARSEGWKDMTNGTAAATAPAPPTTAAVVIIGHEHDDGVPVVRRIAMSLFVVDQLVLRHDFDGVAENAPPARLAEAHGVPGRTVTHRQDLDEALHWARSTPGPVLLEVRVKAEETVLPMVPAGAATGEMICVEGRVLR